jgi:hypothetical protein
MGPTENGSGAVPDSAVGPMADAVAVISATVLPSAAGGEVHGLELVDRLVVSLTGPGPVAVLPTDMLVRTGPGELVVVCPATAGQHRIMAVVDAIRATVLEHHDPELPALAGLSISVAFAGSGAEP